MSADSRPPCWEANNLDFKTFLIKKILISYFFAVTGITAAMGIIGSILASQVTFGYEAFLSPFLFGLVAVVPSIATYSKKELSAKQMLLRLLIRFALLEALIVLFAYYAGLVTSGSIAISLVLSVLLVDLTVHLVMWLNDKRTAAEINGALKKLQSEK